MKKTAPLLIVLSLIFSCGRGKALESAESRVPEVQEAPAPLPEPLHEAFSFTAEDLPALTEGLPDGIAVKIYEQPREFLALMGEVLGEDPLFTRLVNKEIGLSKDDAPHDIVELDDYKDSLILSRPGHRLSARVLPSLIAMTEAAASEGLKLMISSAYRPYDYQQMLFERYAARDGVEAAERYSARPGKSQHQLGTAMDFGSIDDSFAETAEGKWLKENAWRYGFSLSYPVGMEEYTGYMWESWHYRYTGIPCCRLEQEFFGGIQERTLRYLHIKGDLFRAALSE
jgi:D-alanyl-D-alanine carboxypeptidase